MNSTTTERQKGKRAVEFLFTGPRAAGFMPAGLIPAGIKPAARRWRGLIFLAMLAGLLAFCHGCHGDIDDELLSLGWWIAAGK